MHYASKTASASRGIPAIRLTLWNPSGFSVPAQFLVLIQNPAGGGIRQFNRFLADLAQAGFVRFQRNPQQEKAKVVRPKQIRVTIFPQKLCLEASQTLGMRYNV